MPLFSKKEPQNEIERIWSYLFYPLAAGGICFTSVSVGMMMAAFKRQDMARNVFWQKMRLAGHGLTLGVFAFNMILPYFSNYFLFFRLAQRASPGPPPGDSS